MTPDAGDGRSRLEMYRDGKLKHGYLAKPDPRGIDEFEEVIADSCREEATFMNATLLASFSPDSSQVIHNMTVTETRGAKTSVRTLEGRDELTEATAELFGIPPADHGGSHR